MSGQGLPAAQRIRRKLEFERVFKRGIRVHGRFMTLFLLPNGGAAARFGVAATRKIGTAVDRNRAKRLSREVFRRKKAAIGLDVVVVPRREMLDASFVTLENDYRAALDRAGRELSSRARDRRHSRPQDDKSV
jgi:ribonuclease P protein component